MALQACGLSYTSKALKAIQTIIVYKIEYAIVMSPATNNALQSPAINIDWNALGASGNSNVTFQVGTGGSGTGGQKTSRKAAGSQQGPTAIWKELKPFYLTPDPDITLTTSNNGVFTYRVKLSAFSSTLAPGDTLSLVARSYDTAAGKVLGEWSLGEFVLDTTAPSVILEGAASPLLFPAEPPSGTLRKFNSGARTAELELNAACSEKGSAVVVLSTGVAGGMAFPDSLSATSAPIEVSGAVRHPVKLKLRTLDLLESDTSTFQIRCIDQAGNPSDPMDFARGVDFTSPYATPDQPHNKISLNPSATSAMIKSGGSLTVAGICGDAGHDLDTEALQLVDVTGGASTVLASSTCSGDSVSAPGSFTLSMTAPGPWSDGVKNLSVQLRDSAGNLSQARFDITYDRTAPAVSFNYSPVPAASPTPPPSSLFPDRTHTIQITALNVTDAGGSGVASYEVAVGTNADPVSRLDWSPLPANCVSTSACPLTLALPQVDFSAADYSVTLRATDFAGNSTTRSLGTFRFSQDPPATVTGLNASGISASAIGLRWNLPDTEWVEGYRVERQEVGGTWTQVGGADLIASAICSGTQCSTQDLGLSAAGTSYTYRVRAIKRVGAGSGTPTLSASAATVTGTTLSANSNFGVTLQALTGASGAVISASQIQFQVTFANPINVSTFDTPDITWTPALPPGAAVSLTASPAGSKTHFLLAVNYPSGASGTVLPSIPANLVAAESGSAKNLASATLPSSGVRVDRIVPTVTVTPDDSADAANPVKLSGSIYFVPASGQAMRWRVQLSEPVPRSEVAALAPSCIGKCSWGGSLAGAGGAVSIASYQEVAGTEGQLVNGFVIQRAPTAHPFGTLSLSLLAGALKDGAGNDSSLSSAGTLGTTIEKLIAPPFLTQVGRSGWSKWIDSADPKIACTDPIKSDCTHIGDQVSFSVRSFGCEPDRISLLEPLGLFDWECTSSSQDPANPTATWTGRAKPGVRLRDLISLDGVPRFKDLGLQVRHYPAAAGNRHSLGPTAPWWSNCVEVVELSASPNSNPAYLAPLDFPTAGSCAGSGNADESPIYVLTRPAEEAALRTPLYHPGIRIQEDNVSITAMERDGSLLVPNHFSRGAPNCSVTAAPGAPTHHCGIQLVAHNGGLIAYTYSELGTRSSEAMPSDLGILARNSYQSLLRPDAVSVWSQGAVATATTCITPRPATGISLLRGAFNKLELPGDARVEAISGAGLPPGSPHCTAQAAQLAVTGGAMGVLLMGSTDNLIQGSGPSRPSHSQRPEITASISSVYQPNQPPLPTGLSAGSKTAGVALLGASRNEIKGLSILAASGAMDSKDIGILIDSEDGAGSNLNWLQSLWIEAGMQWHPQPSESLTSPPNPGPLLQNEVQTSTAIEINGGDRNAIVDSRLFARAYGQGSTSTALAVFGEPSEVADQLGIAGVRAHAYSLQGDAVGLYQEQEQMGRIQAGGNRVEGLRMGEGDPILSTETLRDLFVEAKAGGNGTPYFWLQGTTELGVSRLTEREAVFGLEDPGQLHSISEGPQTEVTVNLYSNYEIQPQPLVPMPREASNPPAESVTFSILPDSVELIPADPLLPFEPARLRIRFDSNLLRAESTATIEALPELVGRQIATTLDTSEQACPNLMQPIRFNNPGAQ